jgi:hypothetical protein
MLKPVLAARCPFGPASFSFAASGNDDFVAVSRRPWLIKFKIAIQSYLQLPCLEGPHVISQPEIY